MNIRLSALADLSVQQTKNEDKQPEQGYGKARRLTGYDGYIDCLTERQKRELSILESLQLQKHIICTESMDDESRESFASKLEIILEG